MLWFSSRPILSAIVLFVCLIVMIYTVNHLNTSPDDPKVVAAKCNCPKLPPQVITPVVPKVELHDPAKFEPPPSGKVNLAMSTATFPPLPPCRPVEKESAVQRAIIIYYPHHQSEHFFPEIRWLYRSWAEMLRGQPPTWRTDLLIFSYNFSAELRTLGCVNRIRQNKEEPSICRLFLYIPVRLRVENNTDNNFEHAFDDAKKLAKIYNDNVEQMVMLPMTSDLKTFDLKRSESLYVNLRDYGYVDSINVLYEGYNTFKMYDFVLRSDSDVFIYRHFATYIPKNCTFITGGGGFATDFNRRRLQRIARDMDFAHAGISNMESTWYALPSDAFLVANYTLYGMLWLSQYEFAAPERESKLGTIMWPEWHYGVLLLYGQHLALNHLVGTNQIRLIIGYDLLDQSTTDDTTAYVQQGTRLNLHGRHAPDRFSKHAFKMGQYKQSELEKYRNDTTVLAYAMRMALESKYMTLEQLANLVLKMS